MRRRPFGRTKLDVPIIGQGTWQMESDDRASVLASLRRGLDLGMTHIDTAEMYGSGHVEEVVAEAIAGRRDEVFLVSKVLPGNASRKGTIKACEKSLARLKTDRLDVYLLHWTGEHPLEDTLASFEDLERDGKIRAWGVSNFDLADLQRAEKIAGPGRNACNQVLYHLGERAIEHAVLPWCETHGVAVVAYSPFGSGRFPSPQSDGGKALARLAEAKKATARQIALAFLTRRPSLFAIPKSAHPEHVADNAAAADLELSPADLAAIDAAFPRGRPKRDLPSI